MKLIQGIATAVAVIVVIIIVNSYLFDFSPFSPFKVNIQTPHKKFESYLQHMTTNQLKFYSVYEKWLPICGVENKIMNRGDSYGIHRNETFRKTPWSMSSIEIQYFINSSLFQPKCNTLSEALLSISLPPIEHTCFLPWMSSEDINRIMRKYSYIILNGDSVTRQLINGLFMLYTKNWYQGGFPSMIEYSNTTQSYCACDGQFGEAEICRIFTNDMFSKDASKPNGMNVNFTFSNNPVHTIYFRGIINETLFCHIDDNRPVLVYLQAGTHYKTNSSRVIQFYLDPSIQYLQDLIQICNNHLEKEQKPLLQLGKNIKVIFSGVPAVSNDIAIKYPHQGMISALRYNMEMTSYIQKKYPFIVYLNLWNLTKVSISRSSDGFHKLSDYNTMASVSLLNVMDLL